jgi:hypothetical protein
MTATAPARPSLLLLHPAWGLALGTLILNDWMLKGSGWVEPVVTGKLSDFAGMIVAPALFATLIGAHTRRGWFRCHVAVAVVFGLLKLVPALPVICEQLGASFGVALGIRCDPTDLIALPLLWVSFRLSTRVARENGVVRAWQRVATALAASVGLIACLATSAPFPRAPQLGPKAVTFYDSGSERLYALDRATGRTLAAHAGDAEPVVIDQVVIAADEEGARAIDLFSEHALWTLPASTQPRLTACERAVLVTDERSTSIVDANTGRLRARTKVLEEARCAHGLILHAETWKSGFSGTQQDLVALDAVSGERVWRHRYTTSVWVRDLEAFGSILLSHAASGEPLEGLEPTRGQSLWKRPMPWYRLAVAGPKRVAVEYGDEIVGFDLEGTELWRRKGRLLTAAEQRVFVFPEDGEGLLALDASSGGLLWSLESEVRRWSEASADSELLVFRGSVRALKDVEIVALDAATGKLRWHASPAN